MHLRPRLQQSNNQNNDQILFHGKQQNQNAAWFSNENNQSQRIQNSYLQQNNNYIKVGNDEGRNGGRNNSYQNKGEQNGLNKIVYPDNNTSSWSVNQMNQISSGQNTGQFGNGSMLNSNGRGSNNSYIMNQQNDNIQKEFIPRSLQNNYNTINYDDSIQNLQSITFQNQNKQINWQTLQNQNLKPVSAQLQQLMNTKTQSSQKPLTSKEIQNQKSQDKNRLRSKESQDTNKIKSKAKTGRFISNNPKKFEENNIPKQQFIYNNQRPIIPKYLGQTLLQNKELNKEANKKKNENTSQQKNKLELNNNPHSIPIQIYNQNEALKYQNESLYDLPRQMIARNTSNDKNHFKNNEAMLNEQNALNQLKKNPLQSSNDKLDQQKINQKYYLDQYYKEKFNQNKNEETKSIVQNNAQIDFLKQKLNFDKDINNQQFLKFIDYYKQFQNCNNYPLINQLVQNQENANQFQNGKEQSNKKEQNIDQQVNKSSSSEDSDRGMLLMLNQIKQDVLQLKIQKGLVPDSSNFQNQINNHIDPKVIQMQSPYQSQIQPNHFQNIQNFNQIPIQYQKATDIRSLTKPSNQYQQIQENQIQKNEGDKLENFKIQAKQIDQKKEFSPQQHQLNEKYPQNLKQQSKSNQKQQEQDFKNQRIENQTQQNKNEEVIKSQIQKKNEGISNRQKLKNMEEQKLQAKEEEKIEKRRIQTSPITRQLSQKDENQTSQIQGVYLQKNKSNNNFVNQYKDVEQEEKDFLYLNIPASNKSDVEEMSEINEPSSQNQQRIFQNSPLSSKKQLDGQSQSNSAQSKSKTSSEDVNVFPSLQNHLQMQQPDQIHYHNIEEAKFELNSRQRANSNIVPSNLFENNDQYAEEALNQDSIMFDNQQLTILDQIIKMEHLPLKTLKPNMVQKQESQKQNQDLDQILKQNQYQNRNSNSNFEEQKIQERKLLVDNILKSSLIGDQNRYQINQNDGETINSDNGRSISKSQNTCNNSSQKLNNEISQLMIEQKLSSVRKINNETSNKSYHQGDININEQFSHNNGNLFNNEIFLNMLEQKLQNEWIKQQKYVTHDQNLQTDPVVCQQVKQSVSKEIQTENSKSNIKKLSPFETYDLLFIKDLVNNLNNDNEILYDNTSDLKAAFLFLHQEHKNLQFKYQQEKRNSCFVDLQKERIQQITNERDKALEIGMRLRDKIEIMTDIMKIAAEQQNIQNSDQDQAIQQLSEENKQLRQLLQIHRNIQSEEIYSQQENGHQKQKNEWMDSSLEQDNDKNLNVEQEIENGLMQYEQELRRNQDDYLIFLKDEQDRQFNQEIDEHKEILSGIYDQKLIEKTQKIEEQLLDTLTQQITESLTSNIQQQMTGIIRNQLRDEVKQEVRSQLIEEVTLEIKNKYQADLSHQVSSINDDQLLNQNNEIKEDFFETEKQISQSQIKQTQSLKKEHDNEQNEQIQMELSKNINLAEQDISSDSDSPYHFQHQFHPTQQIIHDEINSSEINNQNQLDFKLLLDDQPMTQEEQELLQQLFQREEGSREVNQEREEEKKSSEMQSHYIDNDETQKIIFQEMNRQDVVQRSIPANNEQERRNHNQSQGFQGQHVFNNYFSTNENVVDQVSNELFQGQSRGSQRLESIFQNESQNYNQIPLQSNNQSNDYNMSFKSVQGFQGQSSAQFHDSHQQEEQQQETQNDQNTDQEYENIVNFEDLISYDYSDFLQGLEQNNPYYQLNQNDQPFELSNQIGENFNNQLNNDEHEYDFQQLSRSGESIDFLGDQLEKDLFNSQDNIQAPISFLMDDGELISDIFKLKQSNNQYQIQKSPQKQDFEPNIFDSTSGMRSMLVHMKQMKNEKNSDLIEKEGEENNEREENKEEEYDYFLDAQQDENLLNNNGYHIIDQADLDQSESKNKDGKYQTNQPNASQNVEYDEDIENIQDEELREYRYRNMLEDLKESIQSEDEEANRKKNHS